ncbi:MAG: phosphoribosylformylglycinamidine synthase subunit PurS [Candidatus Omnitrophota bacterium]|jgi:phosphoribosylformylglycinamidine synthase
MFKAKVNVTLKKSVLDPQGKTVMHALDSLGFKETRDVRVGKYFEVSLDYSDRKKAEEALRSMCDRVLINPVIEEYVFDLQAVP